MEITNRIAIIDLGTNTCNLLIAEYRDTAYLILYQGKEVVKLGRNGIGRNLLTADGLERAVNAIQRQIAISHEFHTTDIQIIATSAIREATNREWFKNEIEQLTGLKLQIISGEKEADLIYKGVKLALSNITSQSLILDIGGGSNEFIWIESGMPVWKKSFPVGMARVIERYPPSDPITENETMQIIRWFDQHLEPLWRNLKNKEVLQLIGCSGAFDTLADLIDQTNPGTKSRISQEISLYNFGRVCQTLLASTTEERTRMKGMESIRIEMIVPAVIFIRLIIERLNIQKIIQTDFALREGVLYERIFS